jgi:hypothetical protein
MFTKQGLDSLAHGRILLSEEAIDRELRNLVHEKHGLTSDLLWYSNEPNSQLGCAFSESCN